MRLSNWLKKWVARTSSSKLLTRSRAAQLRRRAEFLEPRCLLANSVLMPSAQWFENVNSASAIGSTGLHGATGVTTVAPEDALVGSWIVQLANESLSTISTPRAAASFLNGFGAEFSVLRGLGLPGQLLVQATETTRADAAAALQRNPLVSTFEADTYIFGPQDVAQLTPTDTRYPDLSGMDNRGQSGGNSDADIDAPEAWSYVDSKLAPDANVTKVGSRSVVVAVVDSGMDLTHPDLVLNTFLNPGEIPAAIRTALQDTDADGLVSFVDLNDAKNATARAVSDSNGNGLIDAADLRADPDWANGQDNDSNGFIDDFSGWDFSSTTVSGNGSIVSNGDNNPGLGSNSDNLHQHGTHVTGIIGAVGNNGVGVTGVSWTVSLLPLRFLDASNRGATSNAVLALNYATMMKSRYQATLADPGLVDGSAGANVRVANNSWGGATSGSTALRDAISAQASADILFVAAAGNGDSRGRGNDNDAQAFFPANYELDNVLSVAASTDQDELAPFSNFGARSVDLAAPGVGIVSTNPGGQYGSLNGTSMAAPHVSGVAALIASLSPDATYSEIKTAILSSTDPVPALNNRVVTGGRLNAFSAVTRDSIRPRAALDVANLTDADAGATRQQFSVTYSDNVAINVLSIDAADVVITRAGTNDSFTAKLDFLQAGGNAPQRTAVYSFAAPGGTWDAADNGTYSIQLVGDQVRDVNDNVALARTLGSFRVTISRLGQLEVTSTVDSVDAAPGNGTVGDSQGRKTLRAAVMEANAQVGDNTIVLPAGTYRLSLAGNRENGAATGDLDVTGTLTILGASDGRTVIDAASLDRVFDVRPGANLTLQNLTVTGGVAPSNEQGGGVRTAGSLTLINVTLNGNSAVLDGGALAVPTGLTADIRNSTFSGNSAGRGGAIFAGGTVSLLNTTLAANSATTGGGIFSDTGAAVTAKNTLVATNTATTGPDLSGVFTSNGNNLIGNATSSTGFVRDVGGNKVGSATEPLNALLGPLADNGGPTFTHDLLRGSPAIDAGNNNGAPTTDQRGYVRLTNGVGTVDIGAVEQVFATLSGIKFHDLNANGLQDPNEPGLSGFRIYLDLNRNGVRETTEPSTVTANDGSYSFPRLLPGSYDVLEEQREGYEQTTPFTLQFASSSLTTGGGPAAVAVGDFNGDSKPDIVVANSLSHNLSLFINTGLGTFFAPQTIALGATDVPAALAADDFDGDGRVDIAIANQVTNTVTILKNLAGNNFSIGAPVSVGAKPTSLSAGRLDGDADVDLIVTNGDGNSVSVLLNNGSGLFAVGSTPVLGSGTNPSASSLTDIDNDGDLDVVVASRSTDSLRFLTNADNGTYTTGATINAGGQAPVALTSADLNADGFVDIAVANNGTTSGSSVAVHLSNGKGGFLSPVTFSGGAKPIAIQAADIDSDGALDLVVLNQDASALSILLNSSETSAGTTSGQSGEVIVNLADQGAANVTILGAKFGDNSGKAVSKAGDVNGDGYDDFLIGAPESDLIEDTRNEAGESYLIWGGPSLTATIDLLSLGTAGVRILGGRDSDLSGTTVSTAGDLNADGFDDLIIGAPAADGLNDAKSGSGDSYVIFGSAALSGTIDLANSGSIGIRIFGADANDRSGTSVSSAGDVNGDGFDDLIIGALRAGAANNAKTQAGESYLIFGSASLPATIDLGNLGSNGVTLFGPDAYDNSGAAVAGVGDLNGDGFDDIAIGAPTADQPPGANRDNAGEIHVVFGGSSFPSTIDLGNLGARGFKVIGRTFGDEWGRSVNAAGDVNGDGLADFLIGAPVAEFIGLGKDTSGVSALIFGRASFGATVDLATLGTDGIMFIGVDRDDQSGTSVNAAGDLNGDGFDDLVIGAPLADASANSRTNAGESYVLFGKTTFSQTIDLQTEIGTGTLVVFGAEIDDQSGVAVGAAGDINGDGLTDLLIGAPLADGPNNGRGTAGETYVVFGSNFTSAVTHAGTSAAETLTGTSSANAMLGGRGNDTLIGNGGVDVLYGGEGNDVLGITDITFRRIDGGTGVDTLRLDGAGLSLDLTTLADSKLSGVEIIDLRGSGANTLTLDAQEVFNLVQSGDRIVNTLNVRRDADDSINMGSGWSRTTDATIDGVAYEVYVQANVTLRLEKQTFIDFGDAPDTTSGTGAGNYQTSLLNNGARHDITNSKTTLFLGASVDFELDATPGSAANNDDKFVSPSVDDEDGVIEPARDLSLTAGGTPKVRLRATNTTGSAATLYGWIDLNRDGVFDNTTERASVVIPTATSGGVFTLTLPTLPTSITPGATYARFRLGTEATAANSTGLASDGEVEDYVVTVNQRGLGTVDGPRTVKIASGTVSLPDFNRFGFSVASLGDFDADGVGDLAIGSIGDDSGGTDRGAVFLQLLNSNGTPKSTLKLSSGINGMPTVTNAHYLGSSLACIGDLDGDGLPELAVGATGDDTGGTNRGAVYVLFLNSNQTVKRSVKLASGLNGAPTLANSDLFGVALAAIGDINGDGIADLAVGAWGDDVNGATDANRGAIYLLRMNADGTVLSSSEISAATGNGPANFDGALFGRAIASVGDLDGNGTTDLAVGTVGDNTGGNARGAVNILFLNASGAVTNSVKIANGANGGPSLVDLDRFGNALANLGDIDGDGISDLAVGTYRDDTGGDNSGAFYVVTLNPNGTAKSVTKIAPATNGGPGLSSGDNFGRSIIGLGDIDGDGIGDIAVGADLDDTDNANSDRGAVYILFGNAAKVVDYGDAPDTTSGTGPGNYQTLRANSGAAHVINLTQTSLYLGAAVDGESDAIASIPANGDDRVLLPANDDEDGIFDSARDLTLTVGVAPKVRVRATNTTGLAATLYGWIDLNRDGLFDNATERTSVAVPSATSNLYFTLAFPTVPLTATAGTTYARFRLSSDAAAANSTGQAVGGEVEDYVITVTQRSDGGIDGSKNVKIASGTGGGPTLANSDLFGVSVARIGDLDGDGIVDMAVGASQDDTGGADRGAVYVQFMNANGTVRSSVKIASDTNGGPILSDGGKFGASVTAVRDLDGDGIATIAVGAQFDDSGRGAVYIIRLKANGTAKSSLKIGSGLNGGPTLSNDGNWGSAVASVGDLDGDGVGDLVVGARYDGTAGAKRGAVYLLRLNADGSVKSSTKIASGLNGGPTLANEDFFGVSVASVGDLDGDGINDIAVGAEGDDTGGTRRGALHLLRLNVDGSVKSSTKIADSMNGGPSLVDVDRFGGAIAALGDLNGDGIADLAVTARLDDTGGYNRGAAYVLLLNADGSVRAQQKLASGFNSAPTLADVDQFGSSIAGIGDLNGDGVIELAVGARLDDTGGVDRGAVHVLFSKVLSADYGDAPDTTSGTAIGNYQTLLANNGPSHTISATQATMFLGARVDAEANGVPNARANGDDVATAPDDEDGVVEPARDLVMTVGAAPKVRVRATNLSAQPATLSGWIDFNRDGVFDNSTERASVLVPTGTDKGTFTLTFPTIPVTSSGGATYARFRLSSDIAALNATGAAIGGEVEDYRATVRGLGSGIVNTPKSLRIGSDTNGGPTLATDDLFGQSVTSIGDLNGDLIDDVVVGSSLDDTGGTNRGAVYVLLLNTNGSAQSRVKIASGTNGGPVLANNDYFGSAVVGVADLDGDGVCDLLAGATGDDTGGDGRGAVYVLFLNSNGTVKSSVKLANGTNGAPILANSDYFGSAVASLGDMNGDGTGDVVVGARGDDTEGTGRGAVHVLLMNANGTIKSSLKVGSGTSGGPVLANSDRFGQSVASLGDLDGDGVSDIAVGSRGNGAGPSNAGAVNVLRLNADGSVKSSIQIANALNGGPLLESNDRFGNSLATVGDLDGDGLSELAVGAYFDSTGGLFRGAVYLMSLNANGTVKTSKKIASDNNGGALNSGDTFGTSIAALGDIDNNGVPELAVGALGDDTGGANRGALHVLFLDRTIVVNSTLDKPDLTPGNGVVDTGTAGEVTLRAAVMEANALAGFQEIFVPAGTYSLTITGRSEDNAATGDLDVATGGLRIRGAGAGLSIIDGGKLDRLLQVKAGASLELDGITLRNGDVGTAQDGGAIDSEGTLTITRSEIAANSARTAGGIFLRANSSLTVTQSSLHDNVAAGSAGLGGAIATQVSNTIALGIVDSQLLNNRAAVGGGAIYSATNLNISNSKFVGNQVIAADNGTARGGAIFNDDNTTLVITSSTFSQNVAQTSGATGQANGGAISSDNGSTLTIDSSTFDQNQALGSGATTNRIGGALASRGGGTITNSTFSGNNSVTGGAIQHQLGTLALTNVTIAANQTSGSGGGVSVASGTLSVRNSLIATNTATTSNPDVSGAFSSLGHNLIGLVGTATGFTPATNGDLVGTSSAINPLIGPLADNGGPTKTHALLVTQSGETLTFSPALDAGDSTGINSVDQRGLPRVVDGDDSSVATTDIGAFELPLNRRPKIDVSSLSVEENAPIGTEIGELGVNDADGDLVSVTLSGADSAAFTINPDSILVSNAVLNFEAKPTYSFTVTATDSKGLSRTQAVTVNVLNVNESPFVIGSGFDDRTRRDGSAADVIDLRSIFGDPDAGTTLAFSVTQNSNPAAVTAQVVNANQLSLTYLPYAANQNRGPSQLTIRATDGGNFFAEDTFTISVTPRGTFEYALVVTRTVTNQPTVAVLPTSLTSVRPTEEFFVEVWVRDLLVSGSSNYPGSLTPENATQGITAAGVDLRFDPALSTELLVDASGSFSSAEAGSVNNVTGLVDNLHGDSPIPDPNTATKYGRLGAVKFRATGLGLQNFSLGLTGNETATQRQADGPGNGVVHPSQIVLGSGVVVGVDPDGGAGATRLFDAPITVPLTNAVTATGLALADFDGRGGIDVVAANTGSNTASVLLNAPGLGRTVILNAGEERQGINFGNRALAGELRGTVYRDVDNVVGQSTTETGLSGFRVFLDVNQNGVFDTDLDGNQTTTDPEPSRLTDANGVYVFKDMLALRDYRVSVVVPSGYLRRSPTANSGQYIVSLGAGETRSQLDFGLAVDSSGASGDTGISGFLYRDADNDRVRDAGEGLVGKTVYLDLNHNAVRDNDEPTATTRADGPGTVEDEAGRYDFLNVPAGSYQVRVDSTTLGAFRQTFPVNNQFSATRFAAGGGPQSVVIGRFNADAQPDLAVANEDSSSISLLLKNGTNFVSSPANDIDLGLRRGFGAFAITAADLNADALDDLVVTNTYSRNVSVLLNSPSNPGTFAAAVNYTVGLTPRAVVVADVDGVSGLDLIVANELGNSVSVLKNTGNGTFAAATTIPLGSSPFGLTAVDLTNDARPEIVVTLQDDNQVAFLKNNGTGLFTVDQKLGVGSIPLAVTAADFNRDNKPDLAVTNFGSNDVSILLNTGTGLVNAAISFGTTKTYRTDPGPGSVVAVDIDRDSDLDLAITHQLPDGLGATDTITLLRNTGSGTFLAPENTGVLDFGEIGSGAARFSIVQGDLDGDLIPDLAVADKDSERISVLQNQLTPGTAKIELTSAVDVTTGTDFIFADIPAADITINLTTNQKVVVQSSASNVQVLINDVIDPSFSALSAAGVSKITITGGTGDNVIDLRGVTSSNFSRAGGVTVLVNAGAGKDTVFGSGFGDQLNGEADGDSLDGGNGNDTLDGGAGLDVLTGGAGSDNIIGGTETDTLKEVFDLDITLSATTLTVGPIGSTTTDTLSGIELASLTGGAAANVINAVAFTPNGAAPAGITTLIGGGGADVITGTNGRDLITANSAVAVTVNAGSGNDTVTTGNGNDSITGGAGADLISAGDGFDTIFGGNGNDTIDGGDKNDLINGQDNDDSLVGGSGNDRLTGDLGNDTLRGGLGDDTLKADTGNDSLFGEDGIDSLLGGDGIDALDGGAGADVLRGDAGTDTLLGGAGNDTLIGGADADSLEGGDDNDDVRGESGNDIVNGGNGNDQLGGFLGNDTLDGGAGTDFISEVIDGDVTVSGTNFTSLLLGTDSSSNVERLHLNGGAGNNKFDARLATITVRLFGNDGNDTLLGGTKVDSLVGGNGDDVLSGGASNDILDGGVGTDTLYEVANTDFTLNATQIISTATGTETLTSIERAALVGGLSNNRIDASAAVIPVTLLGGAGNDTLIGGALADVLIGGSRSNTASGTDSLTGNAGADTLDNDPADTRVTDGFDSVLANVLASIPSWIDAL